MSERRTTFCPKCGCDSESNEVCDGCGVIFEKYRARLNEREAAEYTGSGSPFAAAYGAAPPMELWKKAAIAGVVVFGLLAFAMNRLNPAGNRASGDMVHDGRPMVVEFWAPWCGPCKYFTPIFERVTDSFGDKIKVARFNTDENQSLASEYQVSGIPCVLLFDKEGKLKGRVSGAVPDAALKAAIDEIL